MKQTRKLYGMKYAAHISKQPVGTEEAERREKNLYKSATTIKQPTQVAWMSATAKNSHKGILFYLMRSFIDMRFALKWGSSSQRHGCFCLSYGQSCQCSIKTTTNQTNRKMPMEWYAITTANKTQLKHTTQQIFC